MRESESNKEIERNERDVGRVKKDDPSPPTIITKYIYLTFFDQIYLT